MHNLGTLVASIHVARYSGRSGAANTKKYHLRTEQVGFGHTKAMPTMPMQLCNGRRQACGAQRCWRTPAGCAA